MGPGVSLQKEASLSAQDWGLCRHDHNQKGVLGSPRSLQGGQRLPGGDFLTKAGAPSSAP